MTNINSHLHPIASFRAATFQSVAASTKDINDRAQQQIKNQARTEEKIEDHHQSTAEKKITKSKGKAAGSEKVVVTTLMRNRTTNKEAVEAALEKERKIHAKVVSSLEKTSMEQDRKMERQEAAIKEHLAEMNKLRCNFLVSKFYIY
jgi:hypothetical protein